MSKPPTEKQKLSRTHNWNKAQMKCAHAICYRAILDKKMNTVNLHRLTAAMEIFEQILQGWDEK